MRVIEFGAIPIKEYETKCTRCKTHFAFFENEGETVSDERDGDYISIKCPVCRNTCNVNKNKTT